MELEVGHGETEVYTGVLIKDRGVSYVQAEAVKESNKVL